MAASALFLANHLPSMPTARYLHRHHRLLQPRRQLLPPGLLASRALRPQPRRRLSAVKETKEEEAKTAEEITEKYGLEVGLWKVSTPQQGTGQLNCSNFEVLVS
jgi:hypothetical protein